MRWNRNGMLIALTVALGAAGTVLAQEPSVVTPEDLNAARAVERNTHHDEQFGFSITKPEDWAWYTDLPTPEGVGDAALVNDETTKLRGIPVVIVRFPMEAEWVLVNPRVNVMVYEDLQHILPESESLALDDFAQKALLQFQADTQAQGQVLFPPTVVEISGVAWRKFGCRAKLTSGGIPIDAYIETYVTLHQRQYFLVNFFARMVDVPLYRREVDGIIRSFVFEDGGGKKDAPGAKINL